MLAIKFNAWLKLAVLSIFVFAVSACTGQQVNLVYNPVGPSMGAANELPAVIIEEFQSAMPQQSVGENSDGEPYTATSSPTAWVSEALADELVRLGVRASYSPYTTASSYVIKGSLDKLWIEQTGTAQYKVKVAITIQLPENKNGVTFKKSYNAEQSAVIVPTDANLSELAESTLRDLLVPVAQEIKNQLQLM